MSQLQAGAATVPLGVPDWPQTTDGTPLMARSCCWRVNRLKSRFCQ